VTKEPLEEYLCYPEHSGDNQTAKWSRVLIADAHPTTRRGLIANLAVVPEVEFCGEAEDGRKAVRFARRKKPDLVITGLNFRDASGIGIVRAIRTILPKTEVLIVTCHDSLEVARIALRAGARGFLGKSDSNQELIDAVYKVRERRFYIRAKLSPILQEETERMAARNASPDFTLTRQEMVAVLARSQVKLRAHFLDILKLGSQ
jgi:DNA-binding NarL/FixJ family response regulator